MNDPRMIPLADQLRGTMFADVAKREAIQRVTADHAAELEAGMAARDKAAAAHQELIAKLVPLAVELARKAYPMPIIMANVRIAAVQRGILEPTTKGTGRKLSGLGAVAKLAGLRPGGWQRSWLEGSHGNLQREWYAA